MRVTRTIARGVVAGVAGSLVMHAFRLLWERATDHHSQHAIFGFDHESDVRSVQLLGRVLGTRPVSEKAAAKLGVSMHYGYGTLLGAAYAVARDRGACFPLSGIKFGALLWLVGDEIPISLSGISHPLKKSTASHSAALAAHLLFGLTLEALTGGAPKRPLSPV